MQEKDTFFYSFNLTGRWHSECFYVEHTVEEIQYRDKGMLLKHCLKSHVAQLYSSSILYRNLVHK